MPQPIHRSMTATEWALLLTLAVLWGGSYFYVGVAIKVLPPLTIVAFRVGLGAVLLYMVVRLSGASMPTDGRSWRDFLIMGALNNIGPFTLITWSQGHLPSGLAAILNATTPLFGVLVANAFTADEKMTTARLAGVIVGFVGVTVMIGPDALREAGEHIVAELACLLAALSYAFSGVFGRRFARRGQPPMVAATGQIGAAACVMVPAALLVDQPWTYPLPGADVWASLIALAAVSTTLAYIMYYRILATAGAVNLLLVTFLVPVSAILLGAVFLGERLALNHFAGMALIGLGLASIDGRLFRLVMRQI